MITTPLPTSQHASSTHLLPSLLLLPVSSPSYPTPTPFILPSILFSDSVFTASAYKMPRVLFPHTGNMDCNMACHCWQAAPFLVRALTSMPSADMYVVVDREDGQAWGWDPLTLH